MKKIYYGFEILYSEENYDKIYFLLYNEGINSILEENSIIKFYLEEKDFSRIDTLKAELLKLPYLSEKDIYIERIINHDWNREWEQSIEPVHIKDKIIVYPSWKKNELIRAEDKILIEIDPKMSFGTGHNETTQMMLEMLCEHVTRNDVSMLDYGCGTGVLAIAAVKLGLKHAVAIDIDEDALINAKEYIRRNGVSKSIKLLKVNISDIEEGDFDIITANIDRTVIITNLAIIRSKLKTGSKLFLTGILIEEEEEIRNALKEHNLKLIEIRKKAEWLAFCAARI